ncbi:MAG: FAD-dependent thymidylate synthase [bacterium]
MGENIKPTELAVWLLFYTPDPEDVIYKAVRVCYQETANESEVPSEVKSGLIRKVIKRGHLSVIEHVSFTFFIEGISRACSHQLVRHRIASYSQQSQRYVDFEGLKYVIPPNILGSVELKKIYESFISDAFKLYRLFRDRGIPQEDARFVLPNASSTSVVFTMNARELLHFLSLRLCRRAQWEIRGLAIKMGEILSAILPSVFGLSAPQCSKGPCPEGDLTCGDPYIPDWYDDN